MTADRFEGVAQVRDGWAALVSLDVTPVGRTMPVLRASVHNSPAMTIGTFEGSAVRMERTRALAQDSRNDIIMCIEGRTRIRVEAHRVKEREFSPGDVHVWRADQPMRCETAGGFSALMLALPQSLLSDHRVDCEQALRTGGLEAGRPEVRLLTGYARSVADEMAALSEPALMRCASHIHDLAFLALGGAQGGAAAAGTSGVRAARLKAIKADIEAHLTDPDLGVGWITRRHRISERYLRALFADEDTAFTDFVLEQRLALAYRRLGDAAWSHARIGEIAYASGFSDLSWFNRAFHRRFGAPPSQIRAHTGGL